MKTFSCLAILSALAVGVSAVGLAADSTAATDAQATFKSLYGPEVAKAMRTATTVDDVKLAGVLLEAAGASRNDPALLKLICDNAYDLGKRSSAGYEVALEAMDVLSANAPSSKAECLDKVVGIHQLRYTRSRLADRPAAAGVLLEAMVAACDANAQAGNIAAAKLQCMKASRLALSARLPQKEALQAKYKELVAIERSNKLLAGYEARLKADPSHIASREALINIYLIEKNDPVTAAKWLNEDCDQHMRTYLTMAAGDINAIPEPTLMEMGAWFGSLAANAQVAHKGGLLIRAQTFYQSFISKHKDADVARTKAMLALGKIQADIKKYGVKVPAKTAIAAVFSGISRKALVHNPTKIPGVKTWSVEVRDYLGDFNDVEFSKDGAQLITAGQDGAIRFWDVETGKFVGMLMGHDAGVKSLAWSKTRTTLASGSSDKTIRLWDVVAGKTTQTLKDSPDSVYHLAWSPDSLGLASGGRSSSVQVWSVRSGTIAGSLSITYYLRGLAWGQVGVLATGSSDGNVSLWNVRSGKEYGHYPLDQYKSSSKSRKLKAHSVGALALSPLNSKLMAVCFSSGTVKLWKTGTRIFPQVMKPVSKDSKGRNRIGYPSCIDWSPNAKMLAVGDSGERGGDVRFWNVSSGTQRHKVDAHGGSSVYNVTWSPDGKFVATASSDATSSIIDAETGEIARKIQANRSRGAARPDFSADGKLMAYSCRDKTIRIWDIEKARQVSVITTPSKSKYITVIKWSPDAKKIAFLAYDSSTVHLLDVKSGVVSAALTGKGGRLNDVVWSSDSAKILVSESAPWRQSTGKIQTWDVATGKVEFILSQKEIGSHYGLAITADNKILASSASGGKVHLWDLVAKKRLRVIPADQRQVRCLAFSPDGSTLATCGEEKTVKVWSVSTGEPLFGLQKHESEVYRVAFSPDGTKLVSAGKNGYLGVWDMSDGENVAWFRGSNWQVRWMKDSKTIAAASGSGVYFYNGSNGALKGSYFPMPENQGVLISSIGHYSGTVGVEKHLVCQALTASGQLTLSLEEFTTRFGWKNDPSKIKLIETIEADDKSAE
jgi:WD40 repeat protein